MIVCRSIAETREIIAGWHRESEVVGLVPTMGYFHDGHLELMRTSVTRTGKTVVSLFVNPTQFGPGEDLEVYPRDFDGDCAKAREVGVDLMFCPEPDDIYRTGHSTEVSVAGLAAGLCGADRPGHFTGVATVVTKLFNIVQPDYAFFGEKDFQQLRIIHQLTRDLDFPISVVGVPIVREDDGLAMSSRNAYLSDKERREALVSATRTLSRSPADARYEARVSPTPRQGRPRSRPCGPGGPARRTRARRPRPGGPRPCRR